MIPSRLLLLAGLILPLSTSTAQSTQSTFRPTYTRDIAPLLIKHCATCHFPSGSGPFSLLTYDEAASRGALIARVVRDRSMPPWLPARTPARFDGERGLSDEEIDLMQQWVEGGMQLGDPQQLPELPNFDSGWQLGAPNLMIEVPAYTVAANAEEEYRNFVIPAPISEIKYVRAVDLQPGHAGIVHHAKLMVDSTASSREADLRDEHPGFDGMHGGSLADNPPGLFVGWTPGRVPSLGSENLSWPLKPGDDLVLQLHLRSLAEKTEVNPKLGLYFADRPSTRSSALILLGSKVIDIAPGDSSYRVEDAFVLPVDVRLLSIYPHAHYLCKSMKVFAILPDGTRQDLIHIPDWDFNWQDEYRYASPLDLPAGTELHMQYIFDNSVSNPQNPHNPPQRIRYGSKSTDEMAELLLQVVLNNEDDLKALTQAVSWHDEIRDAAYFAYEHRIRGDEHVERRELNRALDEYRKALQYRSDDVDVLLGMTGVFLLKEDVDSALLIVKRAAQLTGRQNARVLTSLAKTYGEAGRKKDARDAALEALRLASESGNDELVAEIQRMMTKI